jgi:hypothetical protein
MLMGHSRGTQRNVTARYTRARDQFIRAEIERVGLGLDVRLAGATNRASKPVQLDFRQTLR